MARDIGIALGSGAYLTGLRRTKVGDFNVADAMTVDEAVAFVESHVKPAGAEGATSTGSLQ